MGNLILTQYNGAFLGPIAKVLGWILNLIFNFLSNFGIENAAICIILFTFIVKALMVPFTIKQQKFTKLSAQMNPEIQKVTSKYKDKKDEESLRKQQLEIQAIYQKYGASPTSGCLPMLITLPILFALYRVIYSIPAYVDEIYVLYENIANEIQGATGYFEIMTQYATNLQVTFNKGIDISESMSIQAIIDILAKFKTADWGSLIISFPALKEIITINSDQIMHINSFIGGLNIADTPSITSISVLVPVAAAGFQYFQTKQITASTPSNTGDTTAATMKTMNNVMPIMSGFFCLALPIGVGLYWVAGSVFQIIQQFFVNKYMETISVDDLIEKNVEKAKKKKHKLGINPNMTMEEYSKKNTKSIDTEINQKASSTKDYATMKTSGESSKNHTSYKAGSIAQKANLLSNRNSSGKGER